MPVKDNMCCFFWIIELGGGLGFESSHWSNWNRCYSPWNGHDIAPENRKGPTRISRKYSFAIQEFRCELLVAGRVWIIMISINILLVPGSTWWSSEIGGLDELDGWLAWNLKITIFHPPLWLCSMWIFQGVQCSYNIFLKPCRYANLVDAEVLYDFTEYEASGWHVNNFCM